MARINLDARIACILVFLSLALCLSCAPRGARNNQAYELPRAQPGYLQWMEKQSMLARAPALISEVSQTGRVWLNNGHLRRLDVLLNAAPNWLELNPGAASAANSPFFRIASGVLRLLPGLDIHGLYLGPLDERLDMWRQPPQQGAREQDYGASAASLEFDPSLGEPRDYSALALNAEKDGIEVGSDLMSAATGIGPDFFLQARNAVGHAGLYAMLPAPRNVWPVLPDARDEWDIAPLSSKTAEKLVEVGILPGGVAQDSLEWLPKGGWAVTGPVTGTDGQQRRWLYRFHANPARPLLLWQDPSAQAKRVFSAAAIRQTGLLGQTLVGLRMAPLMGLEPRAGNSLSSASPDNSPEIYEPGLEAINEISAQIHRYGGWALQADPIPAEAVSAVLAGACDFCREALTPSLVAYGLLFSDAEPLAALYRRWLKEKLEQARLARGFNSWRGIDARILKADHSELFEKMLATFPELADRHFLEWDKIATALPGNKNPRGAYEFFMAWRLGLPGIAFINGDQLALSGNADNLAVHPGTAADNEGAAKGLQHLLAARARHHHARSSLIAVMEGKKNTLALLFRLPAGGFWALAGNFSGAAHNVDIILPEAAKNAEDALNSENLRDNLHSNGQKFTLALDGYQARNVVFYVN